MKQFPGFKFDPHKGKIYFEGDCGSAREICEAMCCRRVHYVDISEEEAKSGLYEFDAVRGLKSGGCSDPCHSGLSVTYILSKKPDGSCVYLDQSNMCTIYDKRPIVCREFQCSSGWSISDVMATERKNPVLSAALKEALERA